MNFWGVELSLSSFKTKQKALKIWSIYCSWQLITQLQLTTVHTSIFIPPYLNMPRISGFKRLILQTYKDLVAWNTFMAHSCVLYPFWSLKVSVLFQCEWKRVTFTIFKNSLFAFHGRKKHIVHIWTNTSVSKLWQFSYSGELSL